MFTRRAISYDAVAGDRRTAEAMPLKSRSVDLVTAAQAFHWFNVERARAEFLRAMKPAGEVAIIWNDRVRGDPVRTAVDGLLDRYAGRKRAALRAHEDRSAIYRLFGGSRPRARSFANEQALGEDGFIGLVFSGSFVPLRTSPKGRRLLNELKSLFRRFERNGMIVARYRTATLVGRPS